MTLADDLEASTHTVDDTPDLNVGHADMLEAYEDGSSAWHDARRQGIGGSDVAKILGMQPYGETRVDLWEQKTGRSNPSIANAATRFGSLIEPYIREWLKRRADDTPTDYGHFSKLIDHPVQMAHPDYRWARAHVDGLIVEGDAAGAGVEIKNSTITYGTSRYDWTDGVREPHYPQIQHYLWVTGLETWWYVYTTPPINREVAREIANEHAADRDDFLLWLVDEGDVTIQRVDRNDRYIERMKSAEYQFWHEHIDDDIRPEGWLPDGEIEVSDPELEDLLDQYGKAKARIDAVQAPDSAVASKQQAKEAIKQRAQSISAAHGDVKKIWVNDEDYVLWHGSGYWVAKPAERTVASDGRGAPSPDDVELGF